MYPHANIQHAEAVLAACRARGWRIATAESCTGGLIAALLTEIPGSSDVFERGFITYTNESKAQILRVPEAMIAEHGAVSKPVARAMAEGALAHSEATLAVSTTGIAGPGGGSEAKPVGLVHLALAQRDGPTVHAAHHFHGDRQAVRLQTVDTALGMVLNSAHTPHLPGS